MATLKAVDTENNNARVDTIPSSVSFTALLAQYASSALINKDEWLADLIRQIQSERRKKIALSLMATGVIVNILLVSLHAILVPYISAVAAFILPNILPALFSCLIGLTMKGGVKSDDRLQIFIAAIPAVISSIVTGLLALSMGGGSGPADLFIILGIVMVIGIVAFFKVGSLEDHWEDCDSNPFDKELNVLESKNTYCKKLLLTAMDAGQVTRPPVFVSISGVDASDSNSDIQQTLDDANALEVSDDHMSIKFA